MSKTPTFGDYYNLKEQRDKLLSILEEFVKAERGFEDATQSLREDCGYDDPPSDVYEKAKALLSEFRGEK